MPDYLNQTHKVTIFGTDFGGAEEWSTSLWLGNVTGGDAGQIPSQEEADHIAAAWQTFFTSTTAGPEQSWKTTGVKIALMNAGGTTTTENTAYSFYGSPISGNTTGANRLPPQVSLVATLTSAKARGFGSKGRMFLPGVGWPVGTNGKIDASQTNNTATALKTFLDAVNTVPTVGGVQLEVVLNAAGRATAPIHEAIMVPVTGVKVGDVYDTQRRRRNQLNEVYTAKVLA